MESNLTNGTGYPGNGTYGISPTDMCVEGELATSCQPDQEYLHFYESAQFVTGLICYPIICVVGLTGNILTLIVLSHKKMLTSTNVFLSALAVADIIKLLNDLLYFLVSILMRTHPEAGNRMMGYMYPFSHYIFNEAVCVAAWLTVSVAVERYISVCHATTARAVCTVSRARIISTLVFFIMSLLAVPSALRYQRKVVPDPSSNGTMFEIELSPLGRNERFMTGYTWVQNLLRSIIPLFVLLILNTCIIHALRKQRVPGKKMSSRNRITMMLIVVIVVFIICIFPDAIMSTFFGYGYIEGSYLVKGIREFTDTLLAINSAVNFMIYCLCSRSFRDIFAVIFFQHCCIRRFQYIPVKRKATSMAGDELSTVRDFRLGRGKDNRTNDIALSMAARTTIHTTSSEEDQIRKSPPLSNGHHHHITVKHTDSDGSQTYL